MIGTARISWNPHPDKSVSFRIHHFTPNGTGITIHDFMRIPAGYTSCIFRGLRPGLHWFSISAVDLWGIESELSNSCSILIHDDYADCLAGTLEEEWS